MVLCLLFVLALLAVHAHKLKDPAYKHKPVQHKVQHAYKIVHNLAPCLLPLYPARTILKHLGLARCAPHPYMLLWLVDAPNAYLLWLPPDLMCLLALTAPVTYAEAFLCVLTRHYKYEHISRK